MNQGFKYLHDLKGFKTAEIIDFNKFKEERELEMNNLIPITGGKEPPDERWLEKLEIGTIFLVTEKQGASFLAPCFIILDKSEKAIKLGSGSIPNPEWVVPHRFRLKYSLLEIQGVYKDDQIRKIEEIEDKYRDIENPKETT